MLPSLPARGSEDSPARLAALHTCLNELQAAMQGGHWELLEQFAQRLEQLIRQLNDTPIRQGQSEVGAEDLGKLLALVGELQTLAIARQQQIEPLLNTWRAKPKIDDASPP